MKKIVCETCGSTDLLKQDGYFICQYCGVKYTVEDVRKMMIEGTVDIQGTIKVDNSALLQNHLSNARRAVDTEDWEKAIKYFDLVEENCPNTIEATVFGSYARVILAMSDKQYVHREQKFSVLIKNISAVEKYYDTTDEDKRAVIERISKAIIKLRSADFVYNGNLKEGAIGSKYWQTKLISEVEKTFAKVLRSIHSSHGEEYILLIIEKHENPPKRKIRKSMAVWSTIFIVMAVSYFIMGILDQPTTGIAMAPFSLIIGTMFLVLGYTPKESKVMYFFDKPSKMKKKTFVLLCIIFGMVLFGIVMINLTI